jgi:hypothetical protein
MKIAQLVGKKLDQFVVKSDKARPSDTAVGIEIEVENLSEADYGLKLWDQIRDGSIVNGVEFVSKPVWGTAITDALDELRRVFTEHDPYLSFRTSVHVHINALDMTPEQLEHFVVLYLMYELPLFRLHEHWGRYDNIFCVPARKSIKVQDGYAKLLADLSVERIRTDYVGYKYSAFNPNALARFGTMEFRHMGGSADMDEVDRWINILLQLKLAADEIIPITEPDSVFGPYRGLLDIHDEDIMDGVQLIDYIQMKRGI